MPARSFVSIPFPCSRESPSSVTCAIAYSGRCFCVTRAMISSVISPGCTPCAFDRAEIRHRRLRQLQVPDLVLARVHDEAAFLIRDLAVREVLGRARVPRIVRDLALAVVVAERDVIERSREDRAVQLVLRNGGEPFVLDLRCEAVGHEDVVVLS